MRLLSTTRLPCRALIIAALTAAPPFAHGHVPLDSLSHPRMAPADRPVAVWLSAGLGGGSVSNVGPSGDRLIAGVARANVSIGKLLVTARSTSLGPFFSGGDGVSDAALLIGRRTEDPRAFASAAVGIASASAYHIPCEGCARKVASGVAALAYEVVLHANVFVPGVAVSFSGDVGPKGASYSTLTFGFELGWFGR